MYCEGLDSEPRPLPCHADLPRIDERDGFRVDKKRGLRVSGTLGLLDLAADPSADRGLVDFAEAIRQLQACKLSASEHGGPGESGGATAYVQEDHSGHKVLVLVEAALAVSAVLLSPYGFRSLGRWQSAA